MCGDCAGIRFTPVPIDRAVVILEVPAGMSPVDVWRRVE